MTSVNKHNPSVCKLYSFYWELPQKFLEEKDVDSYFYYINFDTSQSQHRIAQVSIVSIKKFSGIRLFQLCDLKSQPRLTLEDELIFSKRELVSSVDSLRDFLQSFD